MPMRVRPAGRMTDDELFELCALNRELVIERTKEGELIITSPTGAESTWLAARSSRGSSMPTPGE
jgi:Uma2 family endonuclease